MYKHLLYILLLVHGICALIYSALILLKISRLRKELILPIILVPIFGVLAALVIEGIHFRNKDKGTDIDLHNFDLDNDAYWKNIIQRREDTDILPLEEAVLLNDAHTKRRLMLETLYHDPTKYLDVLMIAKNNEDIETAHYATTTISKIQRDFELTIQKLSSAVENNPDDPELLDKYISIQETYINSGVLEDYLLTRQRILFSKVLEKKLKSNPADKQMILKMISNSLVLKDFDTADKFCRKLQDQWPLDEDTWIESLKVYVESRDKRNFEKTLNDIKSKRINWTKNGRKQVSHWLIG